MPVRWTIYCHTHTDSGRRYIGLTKKTVAQRWNNHILNARLKTGRGCRYFWNAIRKYGKNAFSPEVLEACETLEQANVREDYWIEFYDTRNPEKGFNLARGGKVRDLPLGSGNPWARPEYRAKSLLAARKRGEERRGCLHSLETKEKIGTACSVKSPETIEKWKQSRVLNMERTSARLSAALRGKKLSPEHKANSSAAQFARFTHCKYGHTLTDAYVRSNGHRICRTCHVIRRTKQSPARAKKR